MALVDPDARNQKFDLQLTHNGVIVPMILCDPNGRENKLAFTRDPIRQSSLKMYSGLQKYSDQEPPWTPVAQTDWSGGRGSKDFDKDASMYFDGYQVDTTRPGQIILAGKATVSFNATNFGTTYANTTKTIAMPDATTVYYAWNFAATSTVTVANLQTSINITKVSGSYPGNLSVLAGIGEISGGTVANIVWATNAAYTDQKFQPNVVSSISWDVAKSLNSGSEYAILFRLIAGSGYQGYFYCYESTSVDDYYTSLNGSSWTQGTDDEVPYFTVLAAATNTKAHYFEYKGALYAAYQYDNTTNSKLYLNGDQGVCETTGTTTTVIKTHSGIKNWAADEAIGSIFVLVKGTGTDQPQPWREITDNDASGAGPPITSSFTVSPAFDIMPDDTTIFAIVNSDEWTEIAAFDTNYNVKVTDVLSANGVVYFACGDSAVMVRMYAYDASGTWTYNFSDHTGSTYSDGSAEEDTTDAKFTYLLIFSDMSGTYIMGAKGGYPSQTAIAPVIDYSAKAGSGEAALVWEDNISCGDTYERVRGLELYAHPNYGYETPFALKEGGMKYYEDRKWYDVDVHQFRSSRDYRNGMAHWVQGVYLYTSWHQSMNRYYRGSLDRVGPDKAEAGIPSSNRQGHFSAITGYADILYGSVDAGTAGYSSILAYNEQGWCEMYLAALGQRIQSLYAQSIPGNTVDRLWFNAGPALYWLPLSVDPFNHPDNGYPFCSEGHLITSWIYLELHAVNKLFNSIKVVAEELTASNQYVDVSYQVNNDTSWTSVTGSIDTFGEELDLAATPSVTGYRICFKFRLATTNEDLTPRVLATVLEAITRLTNKYVTTVSCRLDPDDDPEYASALAKFNALNTMNDSTTPATIESQIDMLDGKTAFVDGLTPRGFKAINTKGKTSYVVQFQLIEI
jgi:hypothetical protein